MRQATQGDDVRVHYVGTLSNGAVFDSSREREPMDVSIGAGGLIAAFEDALLGMAVGEVKNITVAPEDAYGPRQEAMVRTVAREQLPPNMDLKVGMMLEGAGQGGQVFQFRVADFDDNRVVLDGNHPLAGQTLKFEIEMVAIDESDD